MRKFPDIAKKCFYTAVFLVLALTFSGAAFAAVRYDKIDEVPGFRFENFVYAWNKVVLDVVNTTSDNRQFEGTIVFLDRRGRTLAKACLLPKNIVGGKSERYTAYFTEGSGESARRARSVRWDF